VTPVPETSEDLELLMGLLTYSQSAASARLLLRHFASVGHVLSAEPHQLAVFGVTARDIGLFELVRRAACHIAKAEVRRRPLLSNWQALIGYLKSALAYEQVEQFRVLFLDRKNNLIADEPQQRGTVDHTPVYPREVIKRALLLNASALIIVHNHPSGDPTPSRDDVEMTRRLKDAAEAVELQLHDHIVIGHGQHTSFRTAGLI
jgi:DNA repair protein RadC